jgi:type IX secretion system PorP/SprF family membrane protein
LKQQRESADIRGLPAGSTKIPNFMKLIRLLSFIVLTITWGATQAQDIHYTLFNMSPLTLNPALTGAFYGTARIGGIFRGQWYNASEANGFETPSFYIDAPLFRGFGKNDWIGVGTVSYNDRAGSVRMRTNLNMLSLAYHLGMNKKGTSTLTLGIQAGRVERRFDPVRFRLADQWDASNGVFGANPSMDDLAGEGRNNIKYFDMSTGLLFRAQPSDKSNLELGVSVGHVIQPEYAFQRIPRDTAANRDIFNFEEAKNRPMLITAHGRYEWMLNEKWSAAPTALFMTTAGAMQVNLQAWAGYHINPEEEIKLNFGLGTRLSDAISVLMGLDYKDLRVMAAYDINTSPLSAVTNYQGAFEISAWYILKVYKKPEVQQVILCPKF